MSEKYKQVFPRRFKEMRLKHGFSQDSLGAVVDQTRSNIANYETGRNFPSTDAMIQISKALHTSIDYLLGKTDDPDLIGGRDRVSIESLADVPLTYNGKVLTEAQRHQVVLLLKSALHLSESND